LDEVKNRHEKIVAYLLGTLDEEGQDRVEKEYFSTPDALQEIDSVEEDLFDAYAANSLQGDEKSRFEERFLSDAAGVERLRFARSLLRWARTNPVVESQSLFSFLFFWRPEPFAVAAQEAEDIRALPSDTSTSEIAVTVPPTGIVVMECDVTSIPEITIFELTLLTTDSAELWRSGQLKPNTAGSRKFLSAYLSADTLKPGLFVLAVIGITSEGRREIFRRSLLVQVSVL
jgi:hypothetical protein